MSIHAHGGSQNKIITSPYIEPIFSAVVRSCVLRCIPLDAKNDMQLITTRCYVMHERSNDQKDQEYKCLGGGGQSCKVRDPAYMACSSSM